jgi:hypothetical protein
LQVIGAKTRDCGEAAKGHTTICASLYSSTNFRTHPPDDFRLRVASLPPWIAAAAGAESCLLRGLRLIKQQNLFHVRTPRRARWPAINTCRTYGIHKRPIQASIARCYSGEISAADACCKTRTRIGRFRRGLPRWEPLI